MLFELRGAGFPELSDVQGKKGQACPEVPGFGLKMGGKGMSYSFLGHDPLQEPGTHPEVQRLVLLPSQAVLICPLSY